MIIEDGEMSIGSLTVGAKTTFIEVERGLRTIDLPLNYTDLDLIFLKTGKYTKEELAFNNLNLIIELAERNLEKNIEKAARMLKMYGINKTELELWVNERLDISKK